MKMAYIRLKVIFLFKKNFFFKSSHAQSRGNINWFAFHVSPTGDPTHNPGLCPDGGSNCQPFSAQETLN